MYKESTYFGPAALAYTSYTHINVKGLAEIHRTELVHSGLPWHVLLTDVVRSLSKDLDSYHPDIITTASAAVAAFYQIFDCYSCYKKADAESRAGQDVTSDAVVIKRTEYHDAKDAFADSLMFFFGQLLSSTEKSSWRWLCFFRRKKAT